MSKSAHTAGPWSVSGVRQKWRLPYSDHMLDSHTVGPDDNRGFIALVPYSERSHTEEFANARLIAAAPDMLEALTALNAALDAYWNVGPNRGSGGHIKAIEAAQQQSKDVIAKAAL